jgi:drug/metabolite transporter (DMT)-like permease
MARAYLAISVVTVLWATNFTMGKFATDELDPFFVAASRVMLTAAAFYAFLPRAERALKPGDAGAIVPLAVTGIAMNHLLFASGIKLTTPSHSAIIHALIPVCVAIIAWLVIREKLGPLGITGMVVAVAGALVVVLGTRKDEVQGYLLGDVLTTIGIVAFSFYTVFGRRVIGTMGGYRAVTFAFVFAVPMMVPFLAWSLVRQDWSAVSWRGWAALAYMFVMANLVCYRFHMFALTRLKAGQVAAFTTLQPAIGITVAVLMKRDVVTVPLVAGAAVALVGVLLVQFRRDIPSR